MTFRTTLFLSAIFLSLLILSCSEESIPQEMEEVMLTDSEIVKKYVDIDIDNWDNYSDPDFPVHYTIAVLQNDNTPSFNPVTDQGASLGRVLFYDKQLSVNGTIACASCHQQALGFTDSEQFSIGFENGLTGTHSMRLGNTNFYQGTVMFWDKRAATLEEQSTQPIKDAVEMGFDEIHGGFTALITRLIELEYYPILFEAAFGDEAITEDRIQRALSQFIRSMVSVNSRFDDGYAEVFRPGNGPGPGNNNGLLDDFPNFTEEENLGKRLFMLPPLAGGAGCQTCHQSPTFALDPMSRSNGLEAGETTIFKSPSLKNIALSGPYMHDGSLTDLEAVVEHYNSGIRQGPALDVRLRQGPNPQRLNLSEEEKRALVVFLRTLTDNELINDLKFSDPFSN